MRFLDLNWDLDVYKRQGFIVNTGDATCQDVLDLISLIQTTVKEQTGIMLECEIRAIGG